VNFQSKHTSSQTPSKYKVSQTSLTKTGESFPVKTYGELISSHNKISNQQSQQLVSPQSKYNGELILIKTNDKSVPRQNIVS